MIWAQDLQDVIGYRGGIPWELPEDLRHFVKLTRGSTVIMGRHTWESLPSRPLKGRKNIVVTSRGLRIPRISYDEEIVGTAHSLRDALQGVTTQDAWIIGGSQLYLEGLPYASRVYKTVLDNYVVGDTFAPILNLQEWQCRTQTDWRLSPRQGIHYRFEEWERIND